MSRRRRQHGTRPDPTGETPTRPDRTDSGVVPLRVPAISTQPALANACLRRISARGGIGPTPRSVRSDSRRGHPPPSPDCALWHRRRCASAALIMRSTLHLLTTAVNRPGMSGGSIS